MKALIQRVKSANVMVDHQIIGDINTGILLFLGIEQHDNLTIAEKLFKKIIAYRIFADTEDKMNLSLTDIKGDLLIVSQFTLAADTQKGLRPSFSRAMSPQDSEKLYRQFIEFAQSHSDKIGRIATGKFGADMQISLVNDGPVTFLLEQQ